MSSRRLYKQKKNNKNQYQSYNSSITKENNINEIESNFASIQVDEKGKLTSPNIVRNENQLMKI